VSKPGKVVRLVLGNIAMFLAIVIVLNLVSAVILEVQYVFRKAFFATDARVELPNYTDKEAATIILDEFRDLRTEYRPYVVWSRKPYQGESTTVDAAGDRVHAETTDSPVGVVRFFGGSSTWGTGSVDEGTLPARFNALYPDYKVHNHGESGFYSRPELARLINLVNQDEPMDLIVFYDGGNDMGSLYHAERNMNGSTNTAKIRRRTHPPSEIANTLFGALREVLSGKFWRRHVFRKKDAAWSGGEDSEVIERVARTLINNWRLANAAAEVGGADFIAVLQPLASIGEPRIDHLGLIRPEGPDASARVYDEVRRIVAERPEIDWFVDLSTAFDGDEYIFIDGIHATENGHAIMAARIQEFADPILERRKRSQSGSGAAARRSAAQLEAR
jgi:lysophospholipase L1-like esterase